MAILHGRFCCSTLLISQTIKLFYGIAIFLLLIITLELQICKAQRLCRYGVNWQYVYVCDQNNYNYTEGSTFEGNLNTVMNSLIKDALQTGFNTSVYGKSPDQVYGLLQCRGDATAEQCYNCSQEANTTLRQDCGNARGGLIWFNYCFLRYENYNFIGQLDTNDACYTIFGNVRSANVYDQALDGLFTKLLSEATSGSKMLYASGKTRDSLFRDIYATVQCTRDISIDYCSSCVSGQVASISEAPFNESIASQSLTGSCRVRYEIISFFNSTSLPPPAETPVANTRQNHSRPSSSSTQNDKSSNKLPIILGVAGGLLLLLLEILVVI